MNELDTIAISTQAVTEKVIIIREYSVILDSDVAVLYGVETKRINEAVKNNPDKFPVGYIIQLTTQEFEDLRSKISTAKFSKTRTPPKAFTEQGLYMLATILKSNTATKTTIAIINAFTKLKELSRAIALLSNEADKEKQKNIIQKSGEIISNIMSDDLKTIEKEITMEINLSILKFKISTKKNNK